MKTRLIFLFILFQYVTQLYAQVSLPAFFTDNMVLQRNTVIPVWGRAAANEKIELKFHQQTKTVKADINGRWMARLDAETAGGPFELFIKGNNSILLKNILVGDVWLCSGQSNMERTVGQSDNAAKEMRGANNPFIRHIKYNTRSAHYQRKMLIQRDGKYAIQFRLQTLQAWVIFLQGIFTTVLKYRLA